MQPFIVKDSLKHIFVVIDHYKNINGEDFGLLANMTTNEMHVEQWDEIIIKYDFIKLAHGV